MYYVHWRIYFRSFFHMFVPNIIYIDVNITNGYLFTTAKQRMDGELILCVCVCVCVCLCVGRVCVCAAGGEEGKRGGNGVPLLNFLSSLHLKDVCWLQ